MTLPPPSPELFGYPIDPAPGENFPPTEALDQLYTEQEQARKLDLNFWYNEAVLAASVFVPVVRKVFMCSINSHANYLINELQIDVDWASLDQAALEWVAKYSFDLVTGITDTGRKLTMDAVLKAVDSADPLITLTEALVPIYGPVRAEAIATTETTRAYFEGSRTVWDTSGVVVGWLYHTAEDDLVCPICGPQDGQQYALDDYDNSPPLHPRCRCWGDPVVSEAKVRAAQIARKARLASLGNMLHA